MDKMDRDIETFLRSTTPLMRLKALLWAYENAKFGTPNKDVLGFLSWAVKIADEDGWQEVAPIWFEKWRAEREQQK